MDIINEEILIPTKKHMLLVKFDFDIKLHFWQSHIFLNNRSWKDLMALYFKFA